MDICVFCQHFVDEDDLVHVGGGEAAHEDCADDWAEDCDDQLDGHPSDDRHLR